MKRVFATIGLLWALASPVLAQNQTCPTAPIGTSNNQCASTAFVQNQIGVGAIIAINSSVITGGTPGRILYDNAGTVGELPITGTAGNVVLSNSPTITSPTLVTPVIGVASGTSLTLNGTISGSSSTAPFAYGILGYSDTNSFSAFQTSVNSYAQSIWQNTSNGSTASTDLVVSNNLGTATTFYGNFGINSSGFTGTGAFNMPSAVYVTATSGDLAIGTTTANAIHILANSATTDAITVSSANVPTLNSPSLVTPNIGVATGTSLALGGASIGSNALAVTGTSALANTTIGAGSAISSSGPGGALTSVAYASFGTGSGNAVQGGTITAGGPTGSATVAPIITYNAAGQLTAVSSATITPAVGSITGLGTGVATLLGGASTGTGGPVGSTSPTISGLTVTTSLNAANTTFTGTITAASLSTVGTIAGSLCQTSGGLVLYEAGVNCFAATASSITNGVTTVASGTANAIFYQSGASPTGTISQMAVVNGALVNTSSSGSPSETVTPVLGVAGTSAGTIGFQNVTSGTLTIGTVTGALGTHTINLGIPTIATDTFAYLGSTAQVLSGGATVTPFSIGSVSSGTTTISAGNGPLQWMVNTGASTIAAPVADGNTTVSVTNGSGSGAITLSGFVKSSGSFATANTASASCTATNASPAVFTYTAHGLIANQQVYLTGGTAPTGFTNGTIYYTTAITTNTFDLSATPGGAAINSSSTGSGMTCAVPSVYALTIERTNGLATATWYPKQ